MKLVNRQELNILISIATSIYVVTDINPLETTIKVQKVRLIEALPDPDLYKYSVTYKKGILRIFPCRDFRYLIKGQEEGF